MNSIQFLEMLEISIIFNLSSGSQRKATKNLLVTILKFLEEPNIFNVSHI